MKDLPNSWVILDVNNSVRIHRLCPRDEDRFLPFIHLKRIFLLSLQTWRYTFDLPTGSRSMALNIGSDGRTNRRPETSGRNRQVECNGVRDKLAEGEASLHVCGGEGRHKLWLVGPGVGIQVDGGRTDGKGV